MGKRRDIKNPSAIKPVAGQHMTATRDGLSNFSAAIGTNTDNLLNASTYSFNFITKNRIMLEAMYRTSWVIGLGIDVVADDMTQMGAEVTGSMKPDQLEQLYEAAEDTDVWGALNSTIKWSRLYGTGMGIILIDGQDMSTPLRPETVNKGMFKGILPCDRWQFTPSSKLISKYGPGMGLPEYYTMNTDAILPSLGKIHHSRIIRLDCVELPHYQKMTENLWAESIIERVYDRLLAFDSTTLGAAQLVFKSYLRTWKIKGFRDLLGNASEKMVQAVLKNFEMVRRFQSSEGITLIDSEDDFQTHTYTFAGLDDVLLQFGQQLSGAWEIPLVRMFGQSPAGLNSTGESDLRTYYDGIHKKQNTKLKRPVKLIYDLLCRSTFGHAMPPGSKVTFKPLWQLTETDKADIASKDAESAFKAFDGGIITQKIAMQELRHSSQTTGRFTNITDEDIELADDDFPAPELPTDPKTEGENQGKNEAGKE